MRGDDLRRAIEPKSTFSLQDALRTALDLVVAAQERNNKARSRAYAADDRQLDFVIARNRLHRTYCILEELHDCLDDESPIRLYDVLRQNLEPANGPDDPGRPERSA